MLVFSDDPVKQDVASQLHAQEFLISFPEWIEHQANVIESVPTLNRHWLAAEIRKLARLARQLEASDPIVFEDRLDVMHYHADQRLAQAEHQRGYDAGFADATREEC